MRLPPEELFLGNEYYPIYVFICVVKKDVAQAIWTTLGSGLVV